MVLRLAYLGVTNAFAMLRLDFVKDAAELIVSSDVEVIESVRCLVGGVGVGVPRAVGPVLVVEGLVLAERVQEVGLVHDQGLVGEFRAAAVALSDRRARLTVRLRIVRWLLTSLPQELTRVCTGPGRSGGLAADQVGAEQHLRLLRLDTTDLS